MSPATIVIVVTVCVVCCGACVYGVSQAVRRAKQRRPTDEQVLTNP